MMAMDKRLVEIEKRIAFQERAIAELNEALIGQQKLIKILEMQLKIFKDKAIDADLVKKLEDETPPPHY